MLLRIRRPRQIGNERLCKENNTCAAPEMAEMSLILTPAVLTLSIKRSRASSHIATGDVTSPWPGPRIAPLTVLYWGKSRSKRTADSWTTARDSDRTSALSCWVDKSKPRNKGCMRANAVSYVPPFTVARARRKTLFDPHARNPRHVRSPLLCQKP